MTECQESTRKLSHEEESGWIPEGLLNRYDRIVVATSLWVCAIVL